jgi:hypothetical protein
LTSGTTSGVAGLAVDVQDLPLGLGGGVQHHLGDGELAALDALDELEADGPRGPDDRDAITLSGHMYTVLMFESKNRGGNALPAAVDGRDPRTFAFASLLS